MINLKLRLARISAQKSQFDLSVESGISQSLISGFERKHILASPEQAEKLAQVLGTEVKKIFGKQDLKK